MTRPRPSRRLCSGLTLVTFGLVLIVHPAYLSSMIIYPGTSWGFLPLFHAAITALGVLLISAGWFSLRDGTDVPTDRELMVLSVLILVAVPLYGVVLLEIFGGTESVLLDYEFKRAFVASLSAGAFVVGCGLSGRRMRTVLLGFGVPLVALTGVVYQWQSGALLGPVVDMYFLLTAPAILEIPYLGAVLLLAAGVLGFWTGIPKKTVPVGSAENRPDQAEKVGNE